MKAYIVWGKDSPEDGYTYVFAVGQSEAISQACELLGYDVEYLSGIETTPENAVNVVRSPSLDEYYDLGSVPEKAFQSVVDEIKKSRAMGPIGG